MDTQPQDGQLAELNEARPEVLKIIEGLRHDLEQADLIIGTRQDVEALLVRYEVRDRMMVQLDVQLNQSKATVLELLDHGYPDLPEIEVDPTHIADLDQNRDSITRAQAQFKPRVLTTGGAFVPGEEGPVT